MRIPLFFYASEFRYSHISAHSLDQEDRNQHLQHIGQGAAETQITLAGCPFVHIHLDLSSLFSPLQQIGNSIRFGAVIDIGGKFFEYFAVIEPHA